MGTKITAAAVISLFIAGGCGSSTGNSEEKKPGGEESDSAQKSAENKPKTGDSNQSVNPPGKSAGKENQPLPESSDSGDLRRSAEYNVAHSGKALGRGEEMATPSSVSKSSLSSDSKTSMIAIPLIPTKHFGMESLFQMRTVSVIPLPSSRFLRVCGSPLLLKARSPIRSGFAWNWWIL